MRILLVAQNFYPETFKSNDIAFELAKRGYEVTVLTSLPNYPTGRFFDGYGLFRKRNEIINGVKVIRSLVIPRRDGTGVMLALNYLSWAFFASIRALFLALSVNYDAIIVHQTSPITQGIPALIIKKICRIPMYFWVLDLWPESLKAAGNINNKYILGVFSWITKIMYSNSKKILMSSRGFRDSILAKGDFADKLVYFPNWAEDVFNDVDTKEIPDLPSGFKVMFAGNVGDAQDFTSVMQAAILLKGTDVKIIIIGDGRKKGWVDAFVKRMNLDDVVYTMGRWPLEYMPSFYSKADALFLSLKDEYIFSLTVPAKLQSYMASGKPIIAMINGEAQSLVREAGCGLSCAAGDYSAFATSILKLSEIDLAKRNEMGQNGKMYFSEHFTKDTCMNNMERILNSSR